MSRKLQWVTAGGAFALLLTAVVWQRFGARSGMPAPAKLAEELVYVRASDDVVSAGVRFQPVQGSARAVAVIWIHGWGANFYAPSYVGIGRALAGRGFTTISVNTRMHDIGNVMKHSASGRRVRGGGYWGVTSEDGRDIAAWTSYAEQAGFGRVVLVGHSAGWASAGRYQAEREDGRVAGLVLASGMIGVAREQDPELIAQARRLVAEGAGEDLLRLPKRAFPSFISAATFLDGQDTPGAYKDFFGIERPETAAIGRVKCPILAFFGTRGDVGGERELEALKAALGRRSGGVGRVETALIEGGDHMYLGEEEQVAARIAGWIETQILK